MAGGTPANPATLARHQLPYHGRHARGASVPRERAGPLAGCFGEGLAKRLIAKRDLEHFRELLRVRGVVEVEGRVAADLG
jgi:hypothetical protein